MRTYEVVFIIRPDLPEDEVNDLVEQTQKIVTENEGEVVKTDNWGKRILAYRVQGQREGVYVLLEINSAEGKALHELERRLKVNDAVIKVFSIRVDEERKRLNKLKHKREHRATRRQQRKPAPTAETAPAREPRS